MWKNPNDPQLIQQGWKEGDLTLLKKPIQIRLEAAWVLANSKIFVVHISRQVGKTHWALLKAIEECSNNPNYKVVFISHVETRLEEYFSSMVSEILATCPQGTGPTYVNSSLQFSNGSEILLASDANKNFYSQRGHAYNLIILDEFAFYHSPKALLWEAMYPTTNTTAGKILICSTSPDNPNHYSNELFEKAKVEGWYYKATIHEDETYTKEEIEALKKGCLDDFSWQINYECILNLISPSKQVVPEWEDKYTRLIIKPPQYQFYRHYIGLDSGYRDFCAIVFATHYFKEDKIHFEGELQFLENEVRSDLVTNAIKKKADELWGANYKIFRAIADSADPKYILELNKYDMSFFGVEKKTLRSMINEYRELVGHDKIRISPQCKYLLSNMKAAVWDDKNEKLGKDAFNHHFDHLMSAVYLTRHIAWNDNPVPTTFGTTENTHWNVPPEMQADESVVKLAKMFGTKRPTQPWEKP
jgi:phage terminase large subunit